MLLALGMPRKAQMWFRAVTERGNQTDVFGKHPRRCWDTSQLGPSQELAQPRGQSWDRQLG